MLREAPVETPGDIGTVRRYHAPLRLYFEMIRVETERGLSDSQSLNMEVLAVNSTVGPEGLCPMRLVFGAIPKNAHIGTSPTQLQRAKHIYVATREDERERDSRRIVFGLEKTSETKAVESLAVLNELLAGSTVLNFRTKPNLWESPFTFVTIFIEKVIVQTKRDRQIYRSTCTNP